MSLTRIQHPIIGQNQMRQQRKLNPISINLS